MSLGKKIALILAVLALAALAIGLYTERQLDSARHQTRQARAAWRRLDPLIRMSESLRTYQRVVGSVAERPDPPVVRQEAGRLAADIDALFADFEEGLEESPRSQTEEENERAEAASAVHARLRAQWRQLLEAGEAALSGEASVGVNERLGHVIAIYAALSLTLADAVRESEQTMDAAMTELRAIDDQLDDVMWVWWGCLVALLAGITLSLRQLILRRIKALARGVVALRERHFEHRVEVRGHDELSALGESFNSMAAELESFTHSLEDKVAAQTDEIRRTAAELEKSQKLASIGTLAAGVAHEINNPLEAITVSLDGLTRLAERGEAPPPAELREIVDAIRDDVARCRSVTSQLLDFSRQRPARPREELEIFDLRQILTSATEFVPLRRRDGDRRIVCELGNGPLPLRGDPHQIRQVMLNLILNAVEATEAGGEIRIAAEAGPREIRVVVSDNGSGIERCDLPHLFEPFYTTKGGGQNSGLGLSVVHGIVVNHGGTITAESAGPGRGASFIVSLPRHRAAVA